jgi:hypothetical protein
VRAYVEDLKLYDLEQLPVGESLAYQGLAI